MDPMQAQRLANPLLSRVDGTSVPATVPPAAPDPPVSGTDQTAPTLDADGPTVSADRLRVGNDRAHREAANSLRFPAPPVQGPQTAGLAPNAWYRGDIVAAGQTAPPPRSTSARAAGASLSAAAIDGLAGQSFEQVAAQVRTPADAAAFLGRFFTYDFNRVNAGSGPAGALSAIETIEARAGVCRDQHVVARDLLRANGMQAEQLGYYASDQPHAVTAYQDPTTKKWGIIEYNTLYPADQLGADTAEEALMMVRPTALLIRHYATGNPDERSHIDRMLYTPTTRTYQAFMAGPAPDLGPGVRMDNTGVAVSGRLADDLQTDLRIVTDARTPHLQGTVMAGAWHDSDDGGWRIGGGAGYVPGRSGQYLDVGTNAPSSNGHVFTFNSIEEYHPNLFRWEDVGGSGVALGMGTHSLAAVMIAASERAGLKETTMMVGPMTTLRTNPEVYSERQVTAFGQGEPDLSLRLGAGANLDLGMLTSFYTTGGVGFPYDSYVTADLTARPTDWLGIKAQGYMPLTNHTNNFLASPAARLQVSTPYASISTVQSAERAQYDLQISLPVDAMMIGAFGQWQDDRRTGDSVGVVGAQANLLTW